MKFDKPTNAINRAFDKMADALNHFKLVCAQNKSPVRSVTFRVDDGGCQTIRATYRKK